jgi:hypothetical protein
MILTPLNPQGGAPQDRAPQETVSSHHNTPISLSPFLTTPLCVFHLLLIEALDIPTISVVAEHQHPTATVSAHVAICSTR